MSKASKEALEVLPENTTECPFVPLFAGSKRKLESDDTNGSFFWGEDAKRAKVKEPRAGYVCRKCNIPGHYASDCPKPSGPPGSYVCKICNQPGHFIQHCPEAANRNGPKCKFCKYTYLKTTFFSNNNILVDSCWFCLSNPKVEKHLIVSIGTEMYMTIAKGPIISSKDTESKVPGSGHILLIPITHHSTFGKIPMESQVEVVAEMEKYKNGLKRLFDKYDQDLVSFEVSREPFRGLAHAHVQVVAVPKSKSDQVEKVAREQGQLAGMNFIDQVPVSYIMKNNCFFLLTLIYLQQNPDIPYFKMELPNGKSLVHLLGPKERFNLQFGRYVYICSFNRRKKKTPPNSSLYFLF